MILHIFTIATGIYNQFLDYQYKTIQFLFPGIQKTYNIISDINQDFSKINCNNIINTSYYHICNLPYPLVTLNKFLYIQDMIKQNNYSSNDYFLFADADTIFCDKSTCKNKNIWNDILNELKNNDICYAFSPWNFDKNPPLVNENNLNKKSISHINNTNDKFKYSQTSFLMGKINKLYELNNDIYNMVAYDLNTNQSNRHIAYIMEQSYINKIIYDYDNKQYNMVGNWYIHNVYLNNEINNDITNNIYDYSKYEDWLSPYCICMQKWNHKYKVETKRNSKIFNINI